MPLPTPGQYIQFIAKSRLLDEEQLQEAARLAETSDDVKTLARSLIQKKYLTLWQANQLLVGFTQFHLGKYRLIDLIGRGASCNVFRALHLTMNREVALKVLSRKMQDDEETLSQFYEEARIMAALDHPNIVQVYNVEQIDGRHVIVMELVDGVNLEHLVKKQ